MNPSKKSVTPILLYHGTHAKFDSFDMSKSRDGAHFFTDNESHAASFGVVRAYAVKMSNPMEIDQDALDAAWDRAHPDGEQDDRCLLPRDFVSDFVKQAKEAGHDGLIIREMGDRDIQADMFLPFTPEQIKLASEVESVDHAAVLREVTRLHGRPQDFQDGDLFHRLDRFNIFVKQSIQLSDIDLKEFDLCEETVLEFMEMYRATGTYPPIVFDAVSQSMIDGLHRANALARLGLTQIDSLVGVQQHVDPNWWPAGDDESDDESSSEDDVEEDHERSYG